MKYKLKAIGLKIFLIYVLFALAIDSTYAQSNDSLYHFSGYVISSQGEYPVALAHVINLEQKWGVVADTLGYFEIWVNPGDMLNISAIGFDYLEYPIEGMYLDSTIIISLQSRYYEIPEASIFYLGTYKDFEYKVLNLELPKIELNVQLEKLFKHVEIIPYTVPSVTSPASLIYSLFSKEAKAMKRYVEIKEKEEEVNRLREKFNEHIIRNLTGLSGVEANEFMKFCDFKETYILSVSDYKLYSDIMSKFEEYKKDRDNVEKVE